MNRFVPAPAIPILVAVPLWVETSGLVAAVALASGAVCFIAVLRASLSLATVGGTLAICSLALALHLSSASPNVLMLAAFGSSLLLLVEATHLCRRLGGASVTPSLWRRAIAWWTGRASISLAIVIVVTVLAPLVALSLPAAWAPFVAGIGVLTTFAAAVAFAWPEADD